MSCEENLGMDFQGDRILDSILVVSTCRCNRVTLCRYISPVFSSCSSIRQHLCVSRSDLEVADCSCYLQHQLSLGWGLRMEDSFDANSTAIWNEERAQELQNDDLWPGPFQSWISLGFVFFFFFMDIYSEFIIKIFCLIQLIVLHLRVEKQRFQLISY